MLTNIDRVAGNNPGGNNSIMYSLADHVLNYPNVTDEVITEDLTFINGSAWLNINTIESTISYDELINSSENGPLCQVSIKGIVRGDSPQIRSNFKKMALGKFVVKTRDNAYLTRIAGTPDEVLNFSYKFSTSDILAGQRGYSFEFSGLLTDPPPFLIP